METKANYVRVGIFTLVVLALAFGFVYWAVFASSGDARVPLIVRIDGAVNGLQQGSQVQFNGLPVGTVQTLRLDPNNPGVVIVRTEVDQGLPIKETTLANIGFAGLTGSAFIQLSGGTAGAPSIMEEAARQDTVPVIRANPSDVTDILATARDIAERANNIIGQFETIVNAVGPSVETTATNVSQISKNVNTFTTSLADNSDQIDNFLASLGQLSQTANTVAEGLPDVIAQVRGVLAAVDPQAVSTVVQNVAAVSDNLREQSGNLGSVVDSVRTAANSVGAVGEAIGRNTAGIDTFLNNLGPISQTATSVATRLDTTLESTNRVIAAVDPNEISTTLDGISSAATNISSLAETIGSQKEAITSAVNGAANAMQNVNRITTTVANRSQEIDGLLQNLGPISDNVSQAAATLNRTATSANQLIASIDRDTINQAIGDVRNVTSAIGGKTQEIQSIIDGVDGTVRTLDATLQGFSETRAQVDTLIASVDPAKVNRAVENISAATDNVAKAADSIAGVANSVGARRDDINSIITNADQISAKLNAASTNVQSVVDRINGVLGGAGDGTGLGVDLSMTLRSIRSAAQSIQSQIGPIAANLNQFSGQGLRQVQSLVTNINRTVDNIDSAVTGFAKNPSQLIYGGGTSGVKQFDGRSRR